MADDVILAEPSPEAPASVDPPRGASPLVRFLHQPWLPSVAMGVVFLVICALFTGNDRWLAATALVVVYAVLTIGLNFAQGASGMFTLGTAFFMAIGGYSTAYLTTAREWSPLMAMIAGVVIALVIGALFALLTLRVSEIYLAIATLALVQIGGGLILAYPSITNGVDGIPVIPAFSIGGFTADTTMKAAVFNVVVMTILAAIAGILLRAKPGRAMRAIREDHLASRGAGVKVNRTLNLAFVLAAVYGSIGGSLFAHTIQFVDPTAFSLDISVTTIAMLVIGGSGSVIGAIVGAGALQYASELLTNFKAYSSMLFGLVILFGALVSPVGIVGGFTNFVARVPFLARIFKPQPPKRPDVVIQATREASDTEALATGEVTHSGDPLVATDIVKSFGGVKALQGISVTVQPGQIHALIGPNGSGKSTFINCLSGIYKADSGTVAIGSRRIDGLPVPVRSSSGIARTYQNGRLFKTLTVQENVRIAGDYRSAQPGPLGRRFPDVTGLAWVELIIDLVGIPQLEMTDAGLLGFGNQRRVELARAVALDPQFLLLDEPAAGLSAPEKAALMELLRGFGSLGMGILLVEHSMDVVMGVADIVTVLDFGKMIGHGTPAEIRDDRNVIDAYLGVA
jgi:ABC-type branched-subunit amino acid transport system ATPase component/ABC-type branched-subunit amino acid transport system permease subunit